MPRVFKSKSEVFVTAASRSLSAFLPEASSVPAWRAPVAGAVVVALPAVVPTAESCARAANARSAEGSANAALAHSGLPADDLAPAAWSAELWADSSVPAGCSVRAVWVVLMEENSIPADYSVVRSEDGLAPAA